MASKKKKSSHVTIDGGHNISIGGNVSGSNIITGDNNRISMNTNSVIRDSEIDNAIKNKKRLAEAISQSLSLSEISKLSFELGIDYDLIETKSKTETVFLLIDKFEKQGNFSRFLKFLKATRPDVFDIIATFSQNNAG